MNNNIPTWAYVLGILMILIGGCGIKNDISSIKIREIMGFQTSILEGFKSDSLAVNDDKEGNDQEEDLVVSVTDSNSMLEIENDSVIGQNDTLSTTTDDQKFERVADEMAKLFDVSEGFLTWTERFGYLGLPLSFLLMLGGLFLMIKKQFSIKLAYIALGANIVFAIVRWIVVSNQSSSGLFSIFQTGASIFGILFLIIVGIILFSMDKTDYEFQYKD